LASKFSQINLKFSFVSDIFRGEELMFLTQEEIQSNIIDIINHKAKNLVKAVIDGDKVRW
jgi:hypothetical protein